MYSKSKDQFLENQMREAQDRNAMAEQRQREEMAYGEKFATAETPKDLQETYKSKVTQLLMSYGLDDSQIVKILKSIALYGDAVRLEMMERTTPDIFGSALTDEERKYIIKQHP